MAGICFLYRLLPLSLQHKRCTESVEQGALFPSNKRKTKKHWVLLSHGQSTSVPAHTTHQLNVFNYKYVHCRCETQRLPPAFVRFANTAYSSPVCLIRLVLCFTVSLLHVSPTKGVLPFSPPWWWVEGGGCCLLAGNNS